MGENGYSILIWDGFGAGLVKLNPRLLSEGLDIYGNPMNWWACSKLFEDDDVIQKHKLNEDENNFSIIWD